MKLLCVSILTTMIAAGKTYQSIEYSKPAGVSLQFDADIPDGKGPFPAAILVHGGAWVTGDRKRSVQPLFGPLSEAGIAWFSISYRLVNLGEGSSSVQSTLASFANLGVAIDDVRSAVAYVKAHAAEYNVDPQRVVLIGESAGAQLASMAALNPGPGGDVRGVVGFYGPSDLLQLVRTAPQIPDFLRQGIRGTPFERLVQTTLQSFSPLSFVRKDAPPFLLIHGTQDSLVPIEQSTAMCNAMRLAGAECTLRPVEGAGHGLRRWEGHSGLTAYKPDMLEWLASKLL